MSRHLLFLFMLLPALAIAQAGFTRPERTGYARFGFSTLGSSSFFTPSGLKVSSARYRDFSSTFYGEYGVTNDWTAVVNFPFLRNHRLDTTSSLTALGDATVGFRRRLLHGRTPVSVAVDFGLPTGDSQGIVAVRDTPGSDFRLPTGDGELNTRISLFASRALKKSKILVSAGGGYNIRTRGYTDEFSYSVTASRRLFSRLSISGNVAGLEPARPANLARSVGFGVGEGVALVAIGGEAQYRITNRYSVSGGYIKPLRGKNLLSGGNLLFGFGISF